MQSKAIYYRGINWTKYRTDRKEGGGGVGKNIRYFPKFSHRREFFHNSAPKLSPVTLTFGLIMVETGINIFLKKRFLVLSSYSLFTYFFRNVDTVFPKNFGHATP